MLQPKLESSEQQKMQIKRQNESLQEDDVIAELEKLCSNWKLHDQRSVKERIKPLELSRYTTK
jgi:hypothetical protein